MAVLLRGYAKCIAGQQAEANRRVLAAQPEDTPDGPLDQRLENAAPETPSTPDDDGEESR